MNATGDWFEVHEAPLEKFATTSDTRSQKLREYLEDASQLALGPDAFGHIPFIGPRIYQAYHEHVSQAAEGLSAASMVMSATGQTVRDIVRRYARAEDLARDHALHLEHEHHLHELHLAHLRRLESEGAPEVSA